MAYFLDSDVFIRAKNLHYGFDFCPAFWDWLVQKKPVLSFLAHFRFIISECKHLR